MLYQLSYTPPEADTANLIKVRRADVMHYTGRQCKGAGGRIQAVFGLISNDQPDLSAAKTGAGERNRTVVISLEGCCSTIELHPRNSPYIYQ